MARQLGKIKKGTLALISLIIVSAIVGFVRLGFWLGSEKNNEAQSGNSFFSSARADMPSGDGDNDCCGNGGPDCADCADCDCDCDCADCDCDCDCGSDCDCGDC